MLNLLLKKSLPILFLSFFFYLVSPIYCETLTTTINNQTLNLEENPEEFTFLMVGHAYGAQNKSVYPSSSLIANIQLLNHQDPKFMILLGDSVRGSYRIYFDILKTSLLSKLNFPVFSTPGNHDIANRSLYSEYFGKTYSSFHYGNSIFILLDSELDNANISGEQLDFLVEIIEKYRNSNKVKNVFIFSHRLIWALDREPYREIITLVNGPSYHPRIESNMTKIILPKLNSLKDKKIYLISGDIGLDRSLPLFYEKEKGSNITYIATGLGNTKKDFALKAEISQAGNVTFNLIPLSSQPVLPVESFDLAYWRDQIQSHKDAMSKTPEINTLTMKMERLLISKYFWCGVFFSILGFSLLKLIQRIRSCLQK